MNKKGIIKLGSSAALAILGNPYICYADAINPLINIFTPDTAVSSSVLTVFIILIEAILLRRWIKPVAFSVSLWRSAIINFASSAAGSVAVLILFRDKLSWEISGLFIPMFILTLATETPLLKTLYRNDGLNWVSSAKISFGINLISYAFVFIAQFGLLFAYFVYADFADKKSKKNWSDVSLLKKETGYIYKIERLPSTNSLAKHIIRKYDVVNNSWRTIDPGFVNDGNDLRRWDVQGGIIAYISWIDTEKAKTVIAPYFSLTVLEEGTLFTITKMNGSFADVRVSPDLSKLAVLETTTQNIYVPKDNESHFRLGEACALNIYDLKSGKLIKSASRLALDEGLAWTNDSKNILFSSLRDERLMQSRDDISPSHFYSRNYAKPGQFPIDLFIFNLETAAVNKLVEGFNPAVISKSNEVTFLREAGFYKREIWKMDLEKREPQLVITDARDQYAVSPSGERYLIQVPHRQPLGDNYFLVVVEPDDSKKKFMIDPSYRCYDFRWIQK